MEKILIFSRIIEKIFWNWEILKINFNSAVDLEKKIE